MKRVIVFHCEGELKTALAARFLGAAAMVDSRSPGLTEALSLFERVENLVLPLFQSVPVSLERAAEEAFGAVEVVREFKTAIGRWPRRVAVLVPNDNGMEFLAGAAMAETHVAYLASSLINEECAPNVIRYDPTQAGCRLAAAAAYGLLSGLADNVRGQTLRMRERAQ